MALDATTVWEVRPGAGNDNNGGGYKPGSSGSDFSQQNSPQYALTGLASAGAGDTILSAAAAADMVGNLAQAISGTNITAGFYQVVSVVVGVSITFGTNNSAGSICTGVAASGVINIGGALATAAAAIAALVAGNTVYLKGTLTVTSAQTLNVSASTSVGPLTFNGYSTVRDDGTRATWTTATNSVNLFEFTSSQGYVFKNIDFSCTAGTPGDAFHAKNGNNSGAIVIDNCLIHGWNRGINGNFAVDWSFGSLIVARTSIYSCTSHGVINSGLMFFLGCYIHDNGGDGIQMSVGGPRGQLVVWRCVIKSNAGKGIQDLQDVSMFPLGGGAAAVITAVLESDICNNGSDNIKVSRSSNPCGLLLYNSIVDAAGGYGVNSDQVGYAMILLGAIAWRANTTADTSHVPKSPSDVTLSGDPFTNRGADDFTLNSTAGAGLACKAIGLPTTFPP